MMWTALVAMLLGCGTSGGQIEDVPLRTEVVEGVGLRVQEGARVRQTERGIAVDSTDGRRWFDVMWAEGIPRAAVEVWAARACEAVFWDDAVTSDDPEHPWLGMGGMCNISDRRHWVIVLVRPLGEKTPEGVEKLVVTAYTADYAFVPYEDAWVHFATTALTAGDDSPVETLDAEVVRERVRVGVAKPTGTTPIPGGGRISSNVHEEMRDLYARLPAPPAPDHLASGEEDAEDATEDDAGPPPEEAGPAGPKPVPAPETPMEAGASDG